MRPDYALLVRTLCAPDSLASLTSRDFSRLIDAASEARLLGWLLNEADTRRVPVDAPPWLRDRVDSGRALVSEYERAVRWETDRLERAFFDLGVTWILLKGAGYVAASLTPGRGRKVADIDVLVPFDALARCERALNAHGWHTGELDAYDARYYREWMHELPPMVHEARRSIIDVHHAILPRTSRLQPSSERLLARAVRTGRVAVLCPSHMALHAAAHLFHDGEISGAIRDVVDLDLMFREFSADPAFWPDFVSEAAALGLTRPAWYAVRYARRLLDTPVPAPVSADIARWAPPAPVVRLMDALVERALPGTGGGDRAAAFALYVRSHWLKMPPLMLARHLMHQAFRRDRD